MEIKFLRESKDIGIFALSGTLNQQTLADQILKCLDEAGCQHAMLCLHDVDGVSEGGLLALCESYIKRHARGWEIFLAVKKGAVANFIIGRGVSRMILVYLCDKVRTPAAIKQFKIDLSQRTATDPQGLQTC